MNDLATQLIHHPYRAPGDFARVRIVAANGHDLVGELL
jgi:hypothetical protein